jgi:hypothetical protein
MPRRRAHRERGGVPQQLRDLLPIVLLFLLLKPARAVALTMVGPKPPPKGITPVGATNTGGATWRADRYAALARAGITGEVAHSIVAHWGFESGDGRGEWNYNVGNRMALPGEEGFHLDDGGGPGWYRSYANLDAGVADYLALIQGAHYTPAWTLLQATPTDDAWIRALLSAKPPYAQLDPDTYVLRYNESRQRN